MVYSYTVNLNLDSHLEFDYDELTIIACPICASTYLTNVVRGAMKNISLYCHKDNITFRLLPEGITASLELWSHYNLFDQLAHLDKLLGMKLIDDEQHGKASTQIAKWRVLGL